MYRRNLYWYNFLANSNASGWSLRRPLAVKLIFWETVLLNRRHFFVIILNFIFYTYYWLNYQWILRDKNVYTTNVLFRLIKSSMKENSEWSQTEKKYEKIKIFHMKKSFADPCATQGSAPGRAKKTRAAKSPGRAL